jgi:hypothetical protein
MELKFLNKIIHVKAVQKCSILEEFNNEEDIVLYSNQVDSNCLFLSVVPQYPCKALQYFSVTCYFESVFVVFRVLNQLFQSWMKVNWVYISINFLDKIRYALTQLRR